MQKQKAIQVLKNGHEEFERIIKNLKQDEVETKLVVGKWSTRDVIAHISAWYWEFIREIDSILVDRPIINVPSGDDAFNEREVAARKDKKTKELVDEWEKSFKSLVKRVEGLTKNDWSHVCQGYYWPDGTKVTVQSLFSSYIDSQTSHEGEHARQIFDKLHL